MYEKINEHYRETDSGRQTLASKIQTEPAVMARTSLLNYLCPVRSTFTKCTFRQLTISIREQYQTRFSQSPSNCSRAHAHFSRATANRYDFNDL